MMPPAIGPYRLIRQLGEGGQGVVYLGTAPDGTLVAVKVLREGVAGDGRFAKEIAAARRVAGSAPPRCSTPSLDGERPYIVTEYVEGPTLQQAVRRHGRCGADLEPLAVGIATALAAIHGAGVVHRDLKPANVLLARTGRASSTSASPARRGRRAHRHQQRHRDARVHGARAGSGRGHRRPAADVFAWAASWSSPPPAQPPFGNDSLPAVITRIQYAEPWLGEVPEPLRSILSACLAKDPAARPTMQDVLFQLISGRAAAPPAGPTHPSGHGPAPSTTHPHGHGPGRPRRRGGLALPAGGGGARRDRRGGRPPGCGCPSDAPPAPPP